jgi:hypothetical protein
LLPSEILILGKPVKPMLTTYESLMDDQGFCIKQEISGNPLCDTTSFSPVSVELFIGNLALAAVNVHLIGLKNRHGYNIYIDDDNSMYCSIDKKYIFGLLPSGIDSHGCGITKELKSYIDSVGGADVICRVAYAFKLLEYSLLCYSSLNV